MSDKKNVHGDCEPAVPLYEVVDKKTGKESSSDYTTLNVSTMNTEMNIYAGVSSERPTLSKEGKKAIELRSIPYSALFSRRLNFEVFADLVLPSKIAPSKLT